jgi:hypothetical protein
VFERVVSWIIGGVLSAASFAKALDIGPFVLTIQRLTDTSPGVSGVMAWCVVITEAGLGVMLLSGRWRDGLLSAATALFFFFALLLGVLLVKGVRVPCNCFGPLGLKLSLRSQIALDLALAVLGGIASWRANSRLGAGSFRHRLLRASGIAVGFFICTAMVAALSERWSPEVRGQFAQLTECVVPVEGVEERPWIFLLVDFSDFGCILCLDDFLAMADSVDRLTREGKIHTQLICRRRSDRALDVQQRMLRVWMEGNTFGFDARVDEDSLFERTLCRRTTLVLLDEKRNVLFEGVFPLGESRRVEVIQGIRQSE